LWARKFLRIMAFIVNFLSTQYRQSKAVKVNLFTGMKRSWLQFVRSCTVVYFWFYATFDFVANYTKCSYIKYVISISLIFYWGFKKKFYIIHLFQFF
jgi:hypothetical protein